MHKKDVIPDYIAIATAAYNIVCMELGAKFSTICAGVYVRINAKINAITN